MKYNLSHLKQIKDDLKHPTQRSQSLNSMTQLLIALRFYATGTFQLVVGDTFAVDNATVCRTLHRVTASIAGLRRKYVKFPQSVQAKRDTMQAFFLKSELPGVIGAVDCTHVPIQSPGSDNGEIYRNRKGYFSINVQLISDTNNYITDVVARWPGSVHDSTIFDNSNLRAMFENDLVDGYLVGDGGYACRSYMLTPVTNPITASERRYNAAQVQARNCIERTNGILKRRFPCLKYGMRLKLENILPVIVATVVLHNIAIITQDIEPDDDEELENYIVSRRKRGLEQNYDPVEAMPPVGLIPAGATGMRSSLINGVFA
jgi:nuclease HARBI1